MFPFSVALFVVVSIIQATAVLWLIAMRTGFYRIKKGVIRTIPTLIVLLVLVVPIFQLAVQLPVAHASSSSSFSFAGAGDYDNFWSSSGETRKVVAGIAGSGANFALALGDLAYSDIASTDQSWCVNYKSLYNNVVVVSGNHDSGESGIGHMDVYNQACPFSVLGVPLINGTITDDHGTSYGYEYAFDYPMVNPIARIILIVPQLTWNCCGLSGTYSYAAGTANYNWVSARIDEAKARGEWVMVGWHKTKDDVSSSLWNLMFQKNVDLVMVGHDHVYKRTYQLKCGSDSTSCIANTNLNNYQRGAGLVYVVQGTGGGGLTTVSPDVIIPPGAEQDTQHGFMKYTVTASSLSGQFVSADGSYTDSFTVSSGSSPLATSFTLSPPNPSVGQSVTFTGFATGGLQPYSFAWSFGDGGASAGSLVTHSYSSQGNYTVTLTTTDSNRTSATSSHILAVKLQTTYTFTPTDDTYVEQDTPTTNYGTSAEITADSSPVKNILLKFNIQVSGQVTSATLRLFQIDTSDKGGDFHTAPANWNETTATWNNAPAANPTIFFSLGPVTTNIWYNVSMTSLVTGNGVVSLRVTSSSPTGDGSHFASKENSGGAFAPQLVVTTTPSSLSNTAPALSLPPTQKMNELTQLSFAVLATDDSSQTITLTSTGLPSGASFTSTPGLGSVTGQFNWTPSEAQGPGNYTVSFTATDNGFPALSTSRTVLIIVNEVNVSPVISAPSSVTATVNSTTSFSVTATDSDLPMNMITLTAGGLVPGMSFPTVTGSPASGSFTFNPDSTQLGTTFNITFTATDNGSPAMSTTKSVLITVKQASPPTFTSLSWTKRLSLSHAGNTQMWTARVTNPNPNLAIWVNVRIVGTDTTGKLTFTANSGPILIIAGQTVTITMSQSFDSGTAGLSVNFTAQIDWGYSSNTLSQLSTSTQKGSFKIAA